MSKRYPGLKRLPNGQIEVRWTAYKDGRRVDRLKTLPATMSLAEAAAIRADLAATAREEVRGSTNKRGPDRTTILTDYTRQWLEQRAPDMKPSARSNYATHLSLHILPHLGHIRVADLRRAHLQEWVAWAEKATFIPRTARNGIERAYSRASVLSWWSKLRQVCKDAAADFGIPDPTLRVKAPACAGRTKIREQRTLSPEELQALLDAIPSSWHAEIKVLQSTGMRPGELYALHRNDLDFERELILVRKSHHMGLVGTTKTGESREVPMTAVVRHLLQDHLRRLVATQHPALHTGIVFPASDDAHGWYRLPQSMRTVLERARKAVGLTIRVTPQVLRRTANTRLVRLGQDRLVTRDILGHADEEMTQTYHRSLVRDRAAALEELESELNPGPENCGTDCGSQRGLVKA